jgi:transposase
MMMANETAAASAAHPAVAMSERTVYRWRKRFAEEGYEGLKTRAKTGRPKISTPAQDVALVAAMEERSRTPAAHVALEGRFPGCSKTAQRR